MEATFDRTFKRISSRRAKKGKQLLTTTAGFCSTSLFVFTNDVKMITNSLWCANGNDEKCEKAPFHSPFEGTINLTMSAKEAITSQSPSHKGFLTIFQEESGLGAWNRRWCSVQDNKIYYWLYPEDEVNQNKEPHGEIELRKCKNEHVSVASRLDCARPNTFVLVLLTAAQPGDRSSIITESNGKTTQTKYMLAADSKEERKQWMEVLNKCLQSIHSWNH